MMGLKKDYKTTHLYFISFDSPNLLGGRGVCVCVGGGGKGGTELIWTKSMLPCPGRKGGMPNVQCC